MHRVNSPTERKPERGGPGIQQVHDLSLDLRPSILDDLGLAAAVRWFTNRQAAHGQIKCEFRADMLEKRLDPIIETACFRVAQEALTNVLRHSKGNSVSVELRKLNDAIHLYVRDDGMGFDLPAARARAVRGSSLGLLSMEERAALAGGQMECKSVPGHGTEVHAWFPLKWRETPEVEKDVNL